MGDTRSKPHSCTRIRSKLSLSEWCQPIVRATTAKERKGQASTCPSESLSMRSKRQAAAFVLCASSAGVLEASLNTTDVAEISSAIGALQVPTGTGRGTLGAVWVVK